MTPAEFKTKWAKFSGKESSAYAEHFIHLCRVLGVPTPIEADPTGNDTFLLPKAHREGCRAFQEPLDSHP
jgi:hypothetical protein